MNISVIMPTYNRKEYLQDTINSVFNQLCYDGEIELIIIDDASTDGTEEYISSLENVKIKYILNKTNQGGAKSRNIGVENSTGDYIAFIDSDTIWYKDKLSKQIPVLLHNPNKIIYCRYKKEDGGKWLLEPKDIRNGKIFDNLIYQNFVDTPSVIMRKEFFLSVGGFDNRLPRFQDWDLFLRLSQKYEFFGIEEPLFDSLTLKGSITTNHKARLEALNIIFEKYKDYLLANDLLLERFIIKLINANLILNNFSNCFKIIQYNTIKQSRKIILYLLVSIFSILPRNLYEKLYNLR
jgi:glycosyltransferase involved in cell wall biosynthesis